MKLPPPPAWIPKHRHNGRFWNTNELVELLVVRHGATKLIYPNTRCYRALMAAIRERNGRNSYAKGYGFDWKGFKWHDELKKDYPVKDEHAFALKADVKEYLERGRLPFSVLPYITEHLREAEVRVWAEVVVRAPAHIAFLSLAEAAE